MTQRSFSQTITKQSQQNVIGAIKFHLALEYNTVQKTEGLGAEVPPDSFMPPLQPCTSGESQLHTGCSQGTGPVMRWHGLAMQAAERGSWSNGKICPSLP